MRAVRLSFETLLTGAEVFTITEGNTETTRKAGRRGPVGVAEHGTQHMDSPGTWELPSLPLSHPDSGTPQGGVTSPLLANIFLHHVLDEWFEREVKPRLSGSAFLVRYVDDAIIAFASEEDAQRVMDVLP